MDFAKIKAKLTYNRKFIYKYFVRIYFQLKSMLSTNYIISKHVYVETKNKYSGLKIKSNSLHDTEGKTMQSLITVS